MPIKVWLQSIEASLEVRRIVVHEALSALSEVSLVAVSPAPDIDLDVAIWEPAEVAIVAGWAHVLGGGARTWSGVVQRFAQLAVEPSGLSRYAIKIVPRLALLTQNQDYRVFQGQTIPTIIDRVLGEWHIDHEWRIHRPGPAYPYRVQYGESDYAFFKRLCEEAGFSYFIEEREGRGAVVVLTDDPVAGPLREGPPLPFEAEPNMAAERAYATGMEIAREGAALPVIMRDMDFRRPYFPMQAEARAEAPPSARAQRRVWRPGSFHIDTMRPPALGAAQSDEKRPDRHDPRAGEELAARLLQAEAAHTWTASFETNALDLAPGVVVAIAKHPLLEARPHVLITSFTLDAEHDKEWRARCGAVGTGAPYKPRQETPRPIVHGLQSALVVGLEEGREIHTDAHGRVKVEFFWNREGRGQSCWLRVAQVWTGAGYGLHAMPRVGQEVLVGFLEGSPDQPIVVGALPNAITPPPYPLPTDADWTTLRTRSTPGGDGYNELAFRDRKGQELLRMRAEKDREALVQAEDRELVKGDVRRMVGGDEHVTVEGDRREHIAGDDHKTVDGEVRGQVGGPVSYVVDGDMNLVATGRIGLQAGGEVHIQSASNVIVQAAQVMIQGPGGFVQITQGAVLAQPFVPNQGGVPIAGGGSSPSAPAPPVQPAAFQAPMPKAAVVRLPILAMPAGTMPRPTAVEIVCPRMCACLRAANAKAAAGGRRDGQTCLNSKLREYDRQMNGKSPIKSQVPYDMSRNPPEPIMSKIEPWRGTGRSPAGSQIPDFVEVADVDKLPTQDNLVQVVEIKFGGNIKLDKSQTENYPKIAGSAPFRTWTEDWPCYCKDRQPQPDPVVAKTPDKQDDAQKEEEEKRKRRMELIAAAAFLLADDTTGAGVVDDVALIPILILLLKTL